MPKTYLACSLLLASAFAIQAYAANDLVIGKDHKTGRPNILIAWRNTERILETEVEVKNLSNRQATGALSIAILDAEGKVLLKSPGSSDKPQLVTLPPCDKGGSEGRIVQLKGTFAMNQLFDSLDRNHIPYSVGVEIVPAGDSANSGFQGGYGIKSFGVHSRVQPSATSFREFSYRNVKPVPVEVTWALSSTPVPANWKLESYPKAGEKMTIPPNGVVNGYISVTTPAELEEGQSVDALVSAIDQKTNRPNYTTEWYAVRDTVAPTITGLGYTQDEQLGTVQVSVTADDATSGLKEASGIRVEYSTDGGLTYSTKVMAYDAGNFVGPTSFNTVLGPFAPGTTVTADLIAEDIAGNIVQKKLEPITIAKLSAQGAHDRVMTSALQ
jgi:hypothetical protein